MIDLDTLRAAARAAAHEEQTLVFLHGEAARLTDELRTRRARHAAEKRDVDELEGLGLGSLFQRMLGTHADRLNKERRELVDARLKLDAVIAELGEVRERIDALELGSEKRARALSEHEEAVQRFAGEIAGLDPALGNELSKLRHAIDDAEKREHELVEALAAAEKARDRIQALCGSLESASNWGTFDMLGGGFFANLGKHSQLDQARVQIAQVQTALRKLERELGDTDVRTSIALDIGGGLSVADWLLDGLFVDWMVQRRIAASLERARQAELSIATLQPKLVAAHAEARNDAQKCRKRRDKLLGG